MEIFWTIERNDVAEVKYRYEYVEDLWGIVTGKVYQSYSNSHLLLPEWIMVGFTHTHNFFVKNYFK